MKGLPKPGQTLFSAWRETGSVPVSGGQAATGEGRGGLGASEVRGAAGGVEARGEEIERGCRNGRASARHGANDGRHADRIVGQRRRGGDLVRVGLEEQLAPAAMETLDARAQCQRR